MRLNHVLRLVGKRNRANKVVAGMMKKGIVKRDAIHLVWVAFNTGAIHMDLEGWLVPGPQPEVPDEREVTQTGQVETI
jgi:hypothetical protein